MKTTLMRTVLSVWTALLWLAWTGEARAAGESAQAPAAKMARTCKGVVSSVDEKGRTFTVKGLWFWPAKTFQAGDTCRFIMDGKEKAALKDLAPGQRVEVCYSELSGVRVANQVEQRSPTFSGHITRLDPSNRSLSVANRAGSRPFILSGDGQVRINGQNKSLNDLQIGQKVTLRYSPMAGSNLVHQIVQNSLRFVGTIQAIDADTRTLKAQRLLTEHTFRLADDCPIVVRGKADAKLSDLRIGDKVVFHYESLDGVLVANRLAKAAEQDEAEPGQTAEHRPEEATETTR